MISEEDKNKLVEIAKKYRATKLYMFGSNLELKNNPKDIDIAVEGVSDSLFFKFYSELIFALSKPVDLIDLNKKTLFNEIIRSEGILLYG